MSMGLKMPKLTLRNVIIGIGAFLWISFMAALVFFVSTVENKKENKKYDYIYANFRSYFEDPNYKHSNWHENVKKQNPEH